jgi:hypothetical protein
LRPVTLTAEPGLPTRASASVQRIAQSFFAERFCGLNATLLPSRFWPSTHVAHPGVENLFLKLPIDIGTYQRPERESSLIVFDVTAFGSLFWQVSFLNDVSK